MRRLWTWSAAAAAVGAFAVAAAQKSAAPPPADCHNAVQGERSVVKARLSLELSVSEEDWPELTTVLRDFAVARDWSFRDESRAIPGRLNSINLSACDKSSLRIIASENHWKNTQAFDRPGRGLPINLYGNVPPETWQQTARELVAVLAARWPERVRFIDKDGNFAQTPSYLGVH